MSKFRRAVRQTLTIARRDFTATVFTPTFLLFLLAPLIMLSFGLVGGMGANSVSNSGEAKQRMVVIAPATQAAALTEIDKQMRLLFPAAARPQLLVQAPHGDTSRQARAMFDRDDFEASAVMFGPLEKPKILRGTNSWREAAYLGQLAEQTLRAEKAGGTARLSTPDIDVVTRGGASSSGKSQAAFFSVFGIFFLTLLLAGQAVGTMAEERSNKVIEILAAAIPLESVFLGKLIGMFGVALLFLAFWGTLIGNGAQLLPPEILRGFADIGPAVGGPMFTLLFIAYFTMSYMLLGAVFLSVGALASTQREIQMLSLPITILQVGMFAFASFGAANPDSWSTIASEIFPLSSPMAMAGRAANSPELWPHALALVWQLLWVGITVTIGARVFRRGVLKSGNAPLKLFGRKKTARPIEA
ncbi:ABC transporter permease [Sphingomonas sp. AOB5]|uniref:ABC transporter permease n=1 Tax=Sphingomonas sp. AOB5 TaxID=3034017 RepID=UPI0023F6F9E0|nr:ABC transporter permease [Sphingomonas sp. AOB5]MDF7773747.1 ABC transporter permease [Sphingomonas sp. AOB5]